MVPADETGAPAREEIAIEQYTVRGGAAWEIEERGNVAVNLGG